MPDREKVISWVEGLAEDDWRLFHSDSEVQNIAKAVLALLKEQGAELQKGRYYSDVFDIGYKAGKESIIRCKDCKHYPNGSGTKWTPCREIIVPPCWFCADGERKEGR